MAGYWRNPEATAQTLRGGWLHTGDLGSLDEAGYLTIRDRSKDMIISGGSNIYPREIEEVLLRHPAVAECSVIGRGASRMGRGSGGVRGARADEVSPQRPGRAVPRAHRALQAARASTASWTACRRTITARCSRPS
jgi:hypothetical protein